MKSIWEETIRRREFPPPEGDLKTDVLIVGGGIAGLLTAYMLKDAGVECTVVEADRICGGVTGYTTAKVTLQHGLIYDKILRSYNTEAAKMYLKAQSTALENFKELCREIPCDYQEQDAYVYSLCNRGKIEREILAYRILGVDAEFCEALDLPLKIAGAVRIKNQGEFNPLKFCFALSEKLTIYENTKVLEFIPKGVITNRGKILADNIVVATHFPIINKHGGYFLKMYQHRSYVLALENTPPLEGMYVDADVKGLSFRSYGSTLLLGGGGHRTGKNGGNWQELEAFAKEHYPHCREVTRWATQDCMTLDSIPYIGQYSPRTPNLYVATGMGKWGMTSSMAAAIILTGSITDKPVDFARVFSPDRSIIHPQLVVNGVETLMNFLTPTVPRCPHLGCALKYNKAERSWDCPCHGSRFSEDGKLLQNPATDDKKL